MRLRDAEPIERFLRVVDDVTEAGRARARGIPALVPERRERDGVVMGSDERDHAVPHSFAAEDPVKKDERRTLALAKHPADFTRDEMAHDLRRALVFALVIQPGQLQLLGCGSDSHPSAGLGAGRDASGAETGTSQASAGDAGSIADATTPTESGGDASTTPKGDPTGPMASRMSDFLDSIGVCVHITQGVDDPGPSASAMAFAGIREMRDDGNPATVPKWIAVFQDAGVRTNVLTNQSVSGTVGMAEALQDAGALLSVEGPNEPNNFPVTYEGGTSSSTTFLPVAHLQRDLYAAIKTDPALTGVPVFASSESGGAEPDDVGLQFLTIPPDAGTTMPAGTQYADYANTHNYVCGHSNALVDNVCWNATDPTLNGDWDGLYVEYGHTWNKGFTGYSDSGLETLPRVSTETGWLTSGTGSITEEQQARVFLDLYLAGFKQGWTYTFIYMLRDDPVQGYWGLFDTSYNPKTSGTYLHNLTMILADRGSAPTGRLDYSIASEPAMVHDLLLQKSSGTFELLVWDERPTGGSDDVVVDLGMVRATVTLYDPTTGTGPTQVLSQVGSVTVTVSDHPVVIEL